jgi:hypothetical protein
VYAIKANEEAAEIVSARVVEEEGRVNERGNISFTLVQEANF